MPKATISYGEITLSTGKIVQVYDVDDESCTFPAYNPLLTNEEGEELNKLIDKLHEALS